MSRLGPHRALLALDLQCDFLQPNGRLPIALDQVAGVVTTINSAVRTAVLQRSTIIAVANAYDLIDPSNLLRNFAALRGACGGRLDPRVLLPGGTPCFQKRAPDAFGNPALEAFLIERQIGELTIGGVYAEACVMATTLSALRRGYSVEVLAQGVGAASQAKRQAALVRMGGLGATIRPQIQSQ